MKGTSPLAGNPHVGPALALTEAAQYADDGGAYANAQAQVAATLALAFEQRTANLIAFERLSQGVYDKRVHERIGARLGLT